MRAVAVPVIALMILLPGCVTLEQEPVAPNVALPPLPPLEAVRPAWTVLTVDATVEHDPAGKHAATSARYVIENRHGAALPWLTVQTALAITSVRVDGAEAEVVRESPTGTTVGSLIASIPRWNVTVPGDVGPGARHVVEIEAEGWEEILLLGGGSVGTDAPASDLNAFPQITLVPVVTTAFRPWLNLTLVRPASWTYALSAFPASEPAEEAGTITQSYRVQNVIVVVFAGVDLPAIRETVDGVEVVTHYHPDMIVQAQTVHEVTKRSLRIMSDLIGPYPYASITTVPAKVAVNAFSTPGLSVLGLNFYRAVVPYVPHQFGRFVPWVAGGDQMEMVIVHEFVHNWYGHQVTSNNSDPRLGVRDNYITEGFTTYLSEIAYYELVYGERDAAASVESKWRDQQDSRARGSDSPVTERGDYYEKAALALRVLHAEYRHAGREADFLRTFQEMYRTYGLNYGGPGIMRHEEVIAAFSATYGADLTEFFRAWFETTDLPDVAVAPPSGTAATVSNVGVVGVPVEVLFRDASGAENMTEVYLEPGASVAVESGLAGPLVAVHADPDWRLDEADKANNVWGAASPIVPPVPLH